MDSESEISTTEPEDLILDLAIHYAVHRSYPPGLSKERKRAVRKRASTLTVDKGEVFLKRKGRHVKLVTSIEDQRRILESCHSDPTSGHFGITKTWRRVAERFYWRGMSKEVKELVKYCSVCQHMNKKLTTERPELHPVPVKSAWYHLGMDFVGPISPPSNNGNRYILTVSDYFTKFAWAKAMPTKEAINVVSALRELFYVMGMPSVMTTDQGTEFRNDLNKELMQVFGIKHRFTTAYHPQANGLDERLNQTLINSLAKFAQENRNMWDDKLQEVVYAYNTAVQESTKHTPFEAMFGRVARLPVDFNVATFYDADAKVKIYQDAQEQDSFENGTKRQRTAEVIKENIKQAQQKQKEHYDLKHGAASCFNTGSLVLKKDFTRKKRKGGKLDYRWQGPFVIIASLGKGLFKLKELNGEKVVQQVNGFHLKRYFLNKNDENTCPQRVDDSDGDQEPNENQYRIDDSIPPLPPRITHILPFSQQDVSFPSPTSYKLNVAILDHSPGVNAFSTPIKQAGFIPEFSPYDLPSPILTSTPPRPPPLTKQLPSTPPRRPPLAPSIPTKPLTLTSKSIISSSPARPPPLTKQLSIPSTPTRKLRTNYKAKALACKLRQQARSLQEPETIVINVDSHNLSSQEHEKHWVDGLTKSDQAVLINNGWLTDKIINEAQSLLKKKYPYVNGLQDVTLGLTLSFAIQTEEFVQILHTGHAHWVTVSNIGCKDGEINIFDSYPPVTTTHLLDQIAALLATPRSIINIRYMDTQLQYGSTDCGIFAIAFAATLASGDQPGAFHFDQPQIRKHLIHCLETQCLSDFPVQRRRRRGNVVKHSYALYIYCSCRMPERPGCTMVQCSVPCWCMCDYTH